MKESENEELINILINISLIIIVISLTLWLIQYATM